MAQQSILLIDDEIIWHKLIRRFLADAGYKIYTAATCADGLNQVELHKPDCILLDFHLTDGDAVSVCAALRANKNIKKTPVIIFSSDPGAEITAYEECRADIFLLKGPVVLGELAATIKKYCAAPSL